MADPLTLPELRRLVGLMRDAFAFRGEQMAKDPLAEFIQNPKITPFLSESLALQLLVRDEVIPGLSSLRLGGRDDADVMAIDRSGRSVRIEVKGTGSTAWVYLSDKDYVADYLLWLFFDDFFENTSKKSIEVYMVRPVEIPERRTRITLGTLTQLMKNNYTMTIVDLERLLSGV